MEALNLDQPLKELSAAKSAQEIAASQLNILSAYYNNVLSQSQRSFYFAAAAAGIGLLFIVAAAGFVLKNQPQQIAVISILGGALSAFVSGINFYLYNKSSSQLAIFHSRLATTQNYLIADGLCSNIVDPNKMDDTRRALIKTIAKVNMDAVESPETPG